MIEYKVTINGIDVAARYTVREVDEIFLPLLRELDRLQKEKGHRILAMLAAPPGAGKTTLLSFLQKLSRETEGIRPIQIIGMDGFHRRQEYLQTHSVLREGNYLLLDEDGWRELSTYADYTISIQVDEDLLSER